MIYTVAEGEADECITLFTSPHTHISRRTPTHANTHLYPSYFSPHTYTPNERKQTCCLPSDPLLNLLPLSHLAEMESYLAKTAAGALASNTWCSYTQQNLLFTTYLHESRRAGWKYSCESGLFCLVLVLCTVRAWETMRLCFPQALTELILPYLYFRYPFLLLFCARDTQFCRIIISSHCPVLSFIYRCSGAEQSTSIKRPLHCQLYTNGLHSKQGLNNIWENWDRKCDFFFLSCFAPISFSFPSTKPKWGLDTKPGPWVPNRFTLMPRPPFILLQSRTMQRSAPE